MELPGATEQSAKQPQLAHPSKPVPAALAPSSSNPLDKPTVEAGAPSPHVLPQDPPTQTRRIRILLADDHRILREGLANLLEEEADFEVVGQAADGEEAVALAHCTRPDIVLMDITMPRLDGVAATQRICQELPRVAVIGLSMHEADQMAEAMRGAGAVAYLTKDGSSHILLQTIRSCCR